MPKIVTIGGRPLTVEDVVAVARHQAQVSITDAARDRVRAGRQKLEERLAAGETIYGINTGVGANARIALSPEQIETFQYNLINQLTCGTGDPLPSDLVRGAMLVRLATFATGASAVRVETAEALAALVNGGITPRVPRYGSLGASGDLIPSAYMARALLGLGDVEYQGEITPAAEALRRAGLKPLRLAAKEGVSLVNGTHVMTAAAAAVWIDIGRLLRALLAVVALTVQALEATAEPFDSWVHEAKGHPGQIAVATRLRESLEGSHFVRRAGTQSCYSLRCAPQGLGPVWESLQAAQATIEREINSSDDNPLVDPDTGVLYQAGNFYGGHMARFFDALKLDLAVIANWGNALMATLVDDKFNHGLPANLVPEPGVNSGFKGMQLSVTSLTCAVRQLAGPSSIHTLSTEQHNQDVVSLGMHAALTAHDALRLARDELAIVLLAAAQAVELRGDCQGLSPATRRIHELVRESAAFLSRDRAMDQEIKKVAQLIAQGAFDGQ